MKISLVLRHEQVNTDSPCYRVLPRVVCGYMRCVGWRARSAAVSPGRESAAEDRGILVGKRIKSRERSKTLAHSGTRY